MKINKYDPALVPYKVTEKEINTMTAYKVAEEFSQVLGRSAVQLEKIIKPNGAPIIRQIIAKCLLNDFNKRNGDLSNLFKILERIIGPIPVIFKEQATSDLNLIYGHRKVPNAEIVNKEDKPSA